MSEARKDPNPHFHVMATMRPLNPDGSWGEKQRREYVLDENGERITGAKGIAIQEWKKEKAQLTRGRRKLYGQYKPLDEELSRLLAVRHCAESVMKDGQKRTIEEQQLMP